MAKHKLSDEAVMPSTTVLGISCHVPDYRLCWSLNRGLGLSLQRRRRDIVEQAQGKELHYPVFEQTDDEGVAVFALIGNVCGRRRLLPGQKEADFFLVAGSLEADDTTGLLERLRGAEFVLAAFPLEFSMLRMGHKLLL